MIINSRNGLLKRLLLVITLVVVLISLLLLALPHALKPLLNRWLPELLGNNGTPAQVEIRRLSWKSLHVNHLVIPLSDSAQVRIDNVHVRYRLADLFNARVDTVNIESVQLNLSVDKTLEVAEEAAEKVGKTAKQQFNQAVVIPELYEWLELPANEIRIDSIQVEHPQAQLHLSAELHADAWRLSGNAHLSELAQPWQIEIQVAQHQQNINWLLMVYEQSQLLLQQYGTANQDQHNTYLHMRLSAEVGELAERFPALHDLPLPLSNIISTASITAPNSGVLPRDLVVDSTTQLTTFAQPLLDIYHWQQGDWQLALQKPTASADWQMTLTSSTQTIRLPKDLFEQAATARLQQQAELNCSADLINCSGQAQLQQGLLHNQQPVASLTLNTQLQWQMEQDLNADIAVNFAIQQPRFFQADTPVHNIAGNGLLKAQLTNNGTWSLRSDGGIQTLVKLDPIANWQAEPLQMALFKNLAMHGDSNAEKLRDQLQSEPITIHMQPWQIYQPETRQQAASSLNILASQVECRPIIGAKFISAFCTINLHTDKSFWQGWPIPDLQFQGPLFIRQDASGASLQSQLTLNGANNLLHMRANIQHHMGTNKGSLQWHLDDVPLNFYTLDLAELKTLTELEVLGGSLAGQGWIDWSQADGIWKITPDISLRADNVGAIYGDSIAIDGFNALLALRRPFDGDYLLDAQISGDSLNPGIELNDILARSQTRIAQDFSWAEISVYEMHTDILGGSLHTPYIRFDTRNEVNAIGIELQNLQLAEIVAIEPSAGVYATGTLDGVLPIIFGKEGPYVPAGSLSARAPGGVIRYGGDTADALAQTNEGVGLAMNLLSDFHYHKLQTDVRYQTDGRFDLMLQFQGRNPNFFGGQATHLNVNLEYNLLDLLESLRVTQDLVSRLEQKYQ